MSPPAEAPQPMDPSLHIDAVTLAVADLGRSADFYERVLGLGLIERDEQRALLGAAGEQPALVLRQLADPVAPPARSTGLFHVAWLHPTRASLAHTVRRVAGARWPIEGASDHGVSEALYLSDPDGLGIEIYADRPRESWQRPPGGRGVRMVTLPLDLEDLLAQAPAQPPAAMEAGVSVGHVHLKVSEVELALAFYRDRLGFEEQARLPAAAFLSAGGYHHHLGLNSWHSAGASPAPANAPGLALIRFALGGPEALAALAARLDGGEASHAPAGHAAAAQAGGELAESAEGVTLRDPDGQLLQFALGAQAPVGA